MPSSARGQGVLALLIVILAWGLTWPVNKVVLATLSPLWAVNDAQAHRIAEEFYRQVFKAGPAQPLGSVLRDLRARWKDEAHLTFLAYVLYGDPLACVSYEPGA